jgi:glutaminase
VKSHNIQCRVTTVRLTTGNADYNKHDRLQRTMQSYNRQCTIITECSELEDNAHLRQCGVTTNNVELQQPTKSYRRQCRVTTVYAKLQKTGIFTTDSALLQQTLLSYNRQHGDTSDCSVLKQTM